MSALWRGHSVQTEVTPLVCEYFERKTLSEIGYRFDPKDLSSFKAQCFGIIANQLNELESNEHKKAAKPKRR